MACWTHQTEAIEWAWGRRISLLHLGMGCGKTRIAIEIFLRHLREQERLLSLVICPKAVIPAWEKQMGLWAPDVRVLCLTKGTSAQKDKAVQAALADRSPLLVVANYDTAWRMKSLVKPAWDVITLDEVHKVKSGTGRASRWAAELCGKNPTARVLGLSGTLIPHSFLDLWGIYRSVEYPECPTFGKYKSQFTARYAVMNPSIPGMILRFKNEDEIAQKLAETTFHRKSEDVLDLPEIMHERVDVEMTTAEADAYAQLESEFAAEIELEAGTRGFVTPANHMVGLLRMLQACQGWTRLDDAKEAISLGDSSKAEALADMLESLHPREPVVIFCRFRGDIVNAIATCEKAGRRVSELSGSANQLAQWQAGETDVLVAQIQSGGIGVDLTRASYGFFLSVGHSLAEYLQAIARLHRPGQTKTTRFYSLVSTLRGNTTADGRVHDALSKRQEVINVVVDWFRSRRGAREHHPA